MRTHMKDLTDDLSCVLFEIQLLLEELGPKPRRRRLTKHQRYLDELATLKLFEEKTGLDLPAMAAAIAAGYPEQVYGWRDK